MAFFPLSEAMGGKRPHVLCKASFDQLPTLGFAGCFVQPRRMFLN
jgi:hypothetical protein